MKTSCSIRIHVLYCINWGFKCYCEFKNLRLLKSVEKTNPLIFLVRNLTTLCRLSTDNTTIKHKFTIQYYQEYSQSNNNKWLSIKRTSSQVHLLRNVLQDEASLLFTLHKIWMDFVEHPISVLSDVISYFIKNILFHHIKLANCMARIINIHTKWIGEVIILNIPKNKISYGYHQIITSMLFIITKITYLLFTAITSVI